MVKVSKAMKIKQDIERGHLHDRGRLASRDGVSDFSFSNCDEGAYLYSS